MTTRQDATAAATADTHTGTPGPRTPPLYGGSGADMAEPPAEPSIDALASRMFHPPSHAVYGD